MSSVKCPQCNLTNWVTAINCKRCGYFFQEFEGITPAFAAGQNFHLSSESPEIHQAPNIQPNYQPNWTPPNPQNHEARFRQPKLKSGLAIASMVIGIIGLVGSCIGAFILTPVGLILGIIALVKANKKSFEYGGIGFAIAGTVLNSVGILLMPIILAIAVPNILAARRAANEASAISSVRMIAGAEQAFRASSGKGRCGELKSLQTANLIDPETAGGQKNGYNFIVINLPTLYGDCAITATPVSTSHGTRSFYYSTEDNVLRAANKKGLSADSNDMPLEGEKTNSREQYPKVADQTTNPFSR